MSAEWTAGHTHNDMISLRLHFLDNMDLYPKLHCKLQQSNMALTFIATKLVVLIIVVLTAVQSCCAEC